MTQEQVIDAAQSAAQSVERFGDTLKYVEWEDIKLTCPEHGQQPVAESPGFGVAVVLSCGALFDYCGPYGYQFRTHLPPGMKFASWVLSKMHTQERESPDDPGNTDI